MATVSQTNVPDTEQSRTAGTRPLPSLPTEKEQQASVRESEALKDVTSERKAPIQGQTGSPWGTIRYAEGGFGGKPAQHEYFGPYARKAPEDMKAMPGRDIGAGRYTSIPSAQERAQGQQPYMREQGQPQQYGERQPSSRYPPQQQSYQQQPTIPYRGGDTGRTSEQFASRGLQQKMYEPAEPRVDFESGKYYAPGREVRGEGQAPQEEFTFARNRFDPTSFKQQRLMRAMEERGGADWEESHRVAHEGESGKYEPPYSQYGKRID
jgi:hypothetical protein